MSVPRFYPSNSDRSFRRDPSKPFGFGSERTRQRHSAPSALERSRHRVRSTSRCRSSYP